MFSVESNDNITIASGSVLWCVHRPCAQVAGENHAKQ